MQKININIHATIVYQMLMCGFRRAELDFARAAQEPVEM